MADVDKIRAAAVNALMPKYTQAFKAATPVEQWQMAMDALREADTADKQRFIDKVADVDRLGIGSAFLNGVMRPYLRSKAAIEVDETLADGTITLDEYERIHG